tara:strand:- start:203 stop:394 length:192 start_codon:yes stop_codon:yes gene_type:complete
MKIGDLVEFSYGRVGGQIDGIGLLAGTINDEVLEVLFLGKIYHIHKQFVKPISMQRKAIVNES